MKKSIVLGVILAGIVFGAPALCEEEDGVNALFNRSKQGWLTVWVYDAKGGCPDLREKDPSPLGFAFAPGQDRYSTSDLKFCFQVSNPDDLKMTRCYKGGVAITKLDTPHVIEGHYQLWLDGSSDDIKGRFKAEYCERINR